MASIFNLDILKGAKYNEYNFKYDPYIKRKNKSKKQRQIQFTSKEQLGKYLNRIIELYKTAIFIRNHILRYCRNKRFIKFIQNYKKNIIMLVMADHKFGNKLNLQNDFKFFFKLFDDIDKSASVIPSNTDEMNSLLTELENHYKIFNEISNDDFKSKKDEMTTSIHNHSDKLYNSVNKLIENYNKTGQYLLESEHLRHNYKNIINDSKMTSSDLKHSILYYSFALTYQNIFDYHSVVSDLFYELKDISK